MKERFDVTGMSCSACSSHVEKSVSKVEGVQEVSVNLLTNSMQVTFDESQTDTGKIIEAVEKAGYGASVQGKKSDGNVPGGERTKGKAGRVCAFASADGMEGCNSSFGGSSLGVESGIGFGVA